MIQFGVNRNRHYAGSKHLLYIIRILIYEYLYGLWIWQYLNHIIIISRWFFRHSKYDFALRSYIMYFILATVMLGAAAVEHAQLFLTDR